jgi:hypothetical protein
MAMVPYAGVPMGENPANDGYGDLGKIDNAALTKSR